MFSKRKTLPPSHKWDRSFLTSFSTDLAKGGFSELTVKLPIDIQTVLNDQLTEDQIISNLKSSELSFDEFLNRERNYKAIILVCKNPATDETIKILFGNMSENTSFGDSTFPSGHSASSTLYVQSPDPARVFPLFDFIYDYLAKQGDSTFAGSIFGFISLNFIAAEIITLLARGKGFFQSIWSSHPAVDVIVALVGVLIVYNFYNAPIGVSVNDRQTANLPNFIRRAIRGEFRDNPVVSIVVTIIATVITAVILQILGL
jgi:hypothetical protein